MPERKTFIGKRLDGKGWDIVLQLGDSWAAFGPYRLERDARISLVAGDYDGSEPWASENWPPPASPPVTPAVSDNVATPHGSARGPQ